MTTSHDPQNQGTSQFDAPAHHASASEHSAPVLPPETEVKKGGLTTGTWIALILGALILVLLLIFVVQNNTTAQFQYFGAQFSLPLGVAMLVAAVAGALVMGLVGSVRIVQQSMTIRKLRKNEARIRQALHS